MWCTGFIVFVRPQQKQSQELNTLTNYIARFSLAAGRTNRWRKRNEEERKQRRYKSESQTCDSLNSLLFVSPNPTDSCRRCCDRTEHLNRSPHNASIISFYSRISCCLLIYRTKKNNVNRMGQRI